MFAATYYAARPDEWNPWLDGLRDMVGLALLLFVTYGVLAELYRFQKEEKAREFKRQAEAKMIQMRAAALRSTSHEVRTPLATITALSETLLDGSAGELNDVQREFVRDIDAASQHLMALVNDILDYAKAEAGMIQLAPEPVAIVEVVQQCTAMVQPKADAAGVTVVAHVAPELKEIIADPLRLKQILLNLMSNAIKYNQPGGSVTVRVRPEGTSVMISVRDTGRGIAAEHIPHLFDPYYQAAVADQSIGTGLGLAIIRHLTELHGGTVQVESVVGVGSVFHVRLPQTSEPSRSSTKRNPAERADAPGRLSFRASSTLRQLTMSMTTHGERFRSEGLCGRCAKHAGRRCGRSLRDDAGPRRRRQSHRAEDPAAHVSGAGLGDASRRRTANACWRMAASRPRPHAILLDLHLTKVDSFEVCRRLKSDLQSRLIPVVAMTSTDGNEERMKALEAGVDEFLSKPINRAELTVRLRSMARIHRFNRELIGAESVALALARAVASKDGYASGHIEEVANYAVMFGESLGLDPVEREDSSATGPFCTTWARSPFPTPCWKRRALFPPRAGPVSAAPAGRLRHLRTAEAAEGGPADHPPSQRTLGRDGVPRRLARGRDPAGCPDRRASSTSYSALINDRPFRPAKTHDEAVADPARPGRRGIHNPELVDKFIACLEKSGVASVDGTAPVDHQEMDRFRQTDEV